MRSVLMVLALVLMPAFALAEAKVALVIGNDNYESVPKLKKAKNDALALEQALSDLGFEVIPAIDVTRREMNRQLQVFANTVKPGDVALLFYAGHAIEIDGENFLLPVDIPGAEPGQEAFVRSEAISLNRVLDRMRSTGARLNIAMLDACRDNPFAAANGRSVGGTRGLSRIAAPQGTFVMYSADAGQSALDRLNDADPNPNSVFTRNLLPLLKKPGMDLVEMARQTRRNVNKLAMTVGHEQTPAYYDSIIGTFRFSEEKVEPVQVMQQQPTQPVNPQPQPQQRGTLLPGSPADIAFWNSVEDSNSIPAYQAYLDSFPNGAFAALARLKIQQLEQAAIVQPVPEPEPQGPVADCAAASKPWERLMCDSTELTALHKELSDIEVELEDRLPAAALGFLSASAERWEEGRDACSTEQCLREVYGERIRLLGSF